MSAQTGGRPRVVVLTAHWETRSESGWITRQVAGALACDADVHVVVPDGAGVDGTVDGAFTVHRLATSIDSAAELRRDLVIESISETSPAGDVAMTPELTSLLDEDLIEPWSDAAAILAELRPELILIAGHQNVGALVAVEEHDPATRVVLLALASDLHAPRFPRFDRLFERADVTLAVTESERMAVDHGVPGEVVKIGAPLSANPSALTEPNPWVGPTDYVLVLTGVDEGDDDEENELSRILRVRFPDNPVGIAHNDAFCAWHGGRVTRGWPVERSSDLDRLMAWARVTVDLRPGAFFARRCVTSLLYGTPIVVPHDSRAREHAERGRGGLWFDSPAELTWCVEALLDPPVRSVFSAQGLAYADEEYGSTDRFIDRVLGVCRPVATGAG
jgi:hypothetical protein